tara:strand:+ start:7 stop:855 length:849 start_codon:yes stop_codon:yes gene_type:complete
MYDKEIEKYLNQYLKQKEGTKLHNIIKYSLVGGKCIRGFIVKHIQETLNNKVNWEPIVAVELVQTASLIIDDLPSMDNDEVRRGKPSTFKVFGKNETILSSFYIVSESLRLINSSALRIRSENNKFSETIHKLIEEWCTLLGDNLVIGQLMDLNSDYTDLFSIKPVIKNEFNEKLIEYKTSSLFSFSFILGGIFSEQEIDVEEYKKMGYYFGMMYQIIDDFKDRKTDKESTNYILKNGLEKSIKKYIESKNNLIGLLTKNGIYTDKFSNLLNVMDQKWNKYR